MGDQQNRIEPTLGELEPRRAAPFQRRKLSNGKLARKAVGKLRARWKNVILHLAQEKGNCVMNWTLFTWGQLAGALRGIFPSRPLHAFFPASFGYPFMKSQFFHVFVRQRPTAEFETLILDKSKKELVQKFVKPYRKGQPIFEDGRTTPVSRLRDVAIIQTEKPATETLRQIGKEHDARLEHKLRTEGTRVHGSRRGRHLHEIVSWGENVTDQFISGPPGVGGLWSTLKAILVNPWVYSVGSGIIILLVGIVLTAWFGNG